MKLLKKLLTGAAVAVAALSMMSCGGLSGLFQKVIGEDIFYYNDATYDSGAYGKWTVRGETNESKADWLRGGKLLFTKHTDLSAYIELNVNNKASDGDGDGVVGLIFDATKNDNGTWNFGVVGVAYDTDNSAPKYYVSHFYNVSDDDMSKKNFGAYTGNADRTYESVAAAEAANETLPYEIVVNGFTALPESFYFPNSAETGTPTPYGTIKIAIQVKEDDKGGYTVNFYNKDQYNEKANTDDEALTGNPVKTSNKMDATKIGKNGPRQAYVGVYGNVYCDRTMNAEVTIAAITNDAIVAY